MSHRPVLDPPGPAAVVELPAGLADLPPGPELGSALASVSLPTLSGRDTITALQAWSRQLNHTTAGFLAAVREAGTALDPDGTARAGRGDEFAAEEVQAGARGTAPTTRSFPASPRAAAPPRPGPRSPATHPHRSEVRDVS